MKVVVTGGCGFIGTKVVKMLTEKGHDVAIVDLKADSPTDIRELDKLTEVMLAEKPEVVVHLAAVMPPNVPDHDMYMTNVLGTANVIEASRQANVRKIVFSSTAAVYGDGETTEGTAGRPISAYGLSKLVAEKMLNMFMEDKVSTMRFFNVYGEGGHGVINILKDCIDKGDSFFLRGDGSDIRDYVPVEMIVDMVEKLLTEDVKLINVGLGRGTSTKDVLDMALAHRLFHVERIPSDMGEISYSVADNSYLMERFPEVYEKYANSTIDTGLVY